MKKVYIFILFFLLAKSLVCQSYQVNQRIVEGLDSNVQVLALGDPTHQESTITKYRVDLIKELVRSKGFNVIALEGNIFELYEAGIESFEKGSFNDIHNSMYSLLNIPELEELYRFVNEQKKKGKVIHFLGFDASQSGNTYAEKAKKILKKMDVLSEKEKRDFIKNLEKANITDLRAIFRNNKKVKSKIVKYSNQIIENYNPETISEKIFFQSLRNLIELYVNPKEKDLRDKGMSSNVKFLLEEFKGAKLILLGSNTHFLNNPKAIKTKFFQEQRETTLGNELRKSLGDKYQFIAYSAFSGEKFSMFSKDKKSLLGELVENSVEVVKSSEGKPALYFDNLFLKRISELKKGFYNSRFLGYSNVEIDLEKAFNALVIIRNVKTSIPLKYKR